MKRNDIELRQWYFGDSEALCQLAEQVDHRLTDDYLPAKFEGGEEFTMIKFMVDCLIYEGELHYAVLCNQNIVGCVNLSRYSGAYAHTGLLRLVLHPDYCGKGIATEVVRRIVEQAFSPWTVSKGKEEPRFESLIAHVIGDNPAAEKALLSNGFSCEGTFKNAIRKDGNTYDVRVFNLFCSTSVAIPPSVPRITLRPWTAEDANLFLKMMRRVDYSYQDENLRPKNLKEAQFFLERMLMRAERTDSIYCAVMMEDEVVGHVQVMRHRDVSSHEGEVGCLIVREAAGHGVGTEAVRQATILAFKDKGFERLTAWIYAPNKASSRMVEKVGFKHEATLRHTVQKNGVYYDSLLYGLLPE